MTWDELRAEAFGEMGVNPTEFYEMDHEDFWLKHKGFFNKRLNEYRLLRWAVSPIVSTWAKDFQPRKHMPLSGDNEVSISSASIKRLAELKENERINNTNRG
jgi:hypothetical protein